MEDTRNKVGKHNNIHFYCGLRGIEIRREKLDIGDYMLPGGKISVDTKESLDEVAANLLNRSDKARFWREVRRAHKSGIKLVILVEEGGIEGIKDVAKWSSRYSGIRGRDVMEQMIRCEMAYGVVWRFCDGRSTGKTVVDILSGGTNAC